MGIQDSLDLAMQDWMGTAGFDRDEDHWPRRWAEAYVHFAHGEKRAWLASMGMKWTPVVGWAERGAGGGLTTLATGRLPLSWTSWIRDRPFQPGPSATARRHAPAHVTWRARPSPRGHTDRDQCEHDTRPPASPPERLDGGVGHAADRNAPPGSRAGVRPFIGLGGLRADDWTP